MEIKAVPFIIFTQHTSKCSGNNAWKPYLGISDQALNAVCITSHDKIRQCVKLQGKKLHAYE